MKVKNFFMLAAMLLTSVCAMAQSGNNEPLKGDVNGDGTVDAADLAAVLKIMKEAGGAVGEKMCYWYAGTNNGNEITESNFTDVASRIPESEIPETGFVSASGQYVYFVVPNTKRLTSLVDADGLSIDYDCTDAFGYHIYKTESTINGNVYYAVEQIIYYWYVGTIQPTDPTNSAQNTGLNKWTSLGTSLPTSSIEVVKEDTTYADHTWYIAAPTDANFTLYNATNVASNEAGWNKTTFNVGSVSYTLWTSKGQSDQAVGYLHK